MKIAVLEKEGRVLPLCEESAHVTVVEIDPVSCSVQQTALLTTPPQAVGTLADWLRQQGVEVVLTSGICRRDRELLEQKGIQVIVGVPPFRVEPVIASFLAGTLETGANACEQPKGDCDLYLPLTTEISVRCGDRVVGGETVVARWRASPPEPNSGLIF